MHKYKEQPVIYKNSYRVGDNYLTKLLLIYWLLANCRVDNFRTKKISIDLRVR
jgi:hypothetical protein